MDDTPIIGLDLKMETSRASLKKALKNLPVNVLAVFAAELGIVLGSPQAGPDLPEDAQQAIDDFQLDIINAGSAKLGGFDDFLVVVDAWERSRNSQKWYQDFLSNRKHCRRG